MEQITTFADFQKDLRATREMVIHPGVLCFLNIIGIITMPRKNHAVELETCHAASARRAWEARQTSN
jgi:hypothetical protein